MVGWHHQLNGNEFEQTPGDGEEQGSLSWCNQWGHKRLDMTELLNHKLVTKSSLGEVPGQLRSWSTLLIWRANQKPFQHSSLLLNFRLALSYSKCRTKRVMKCAHLKFIGKLANIVFLLQEELCGKEKPQSPHSTTVNLTVIWDACELLHLIIGPLQNPVLLILLSFQTPLLFKKGHFP